jgi:hypothetical protein
VKNAGYYAPITPFYSFASKSGRKSAGNRVAKARDKTYLYRTATTRSDNLEERRLDQDNALDDKDFGMVMSELS